MIDKRVGKRIKQRREQLGLTQEQFAENLVWRLTISRRLSAEPRFHAMKSWWLSSMRLKPPLTQFSAMWSRTL